MSLQKWNWSHMTNHDEIWNYVKPPIQIQMFLIANLPILLPIFFTSLSKSVRTKKQFYNNYFI